MLTHRPNRSRASRSTFGSSRSLAGGLIVAVAMLAFIIGLGVSDLTARSRVEPSSQTVGQIVNRTLKGDRLPLVAALHPNAVDRSLKTKAARATASDSKLPDGCDLPVSPLANFELARIAGRCVS